MTVLKWVDRSFDSSVDTVTKKLQEHLTDMQNDSNFLLQYKTET